MAIGASAMKTSIEGHLQLVELNPAKQQLLKMNFYFMNCDKMKLTKKYIKTVYLLLESRHD